MSALSFIAPDVEILPPSSGRGGKSQEAPARSSRTQDVILGQMACGMAESNALKRELSEIMERLETLAEHFASVSCADAVALRYANNAQRLKNEVAAMFAGIVPFEL